MQGSKVRAAAQGKMTSCPHIIKRSQGSMEIVMECGDCKQSGLEIPVCYRGVLRAIQQEGPPWAIILRSHIEKRYDAPSTWAMNHLAGILNNADDLMGQLSADKRRSEKCAACLGSLADGLAGLKSSVLSMRLGDSVRQAGELADYDFRKGADCDQCSGMTKMRLTKISSMAKELENHVLAGAFHIVGVEK